MWLEVYGSKFQWTFILKVCLRKILKFLENFVLQAFVLSGLSWSKVRRSTIKHLGFPSSDEFFLIFRNRKWSSNCVTTCPSCRRRSTPVRTCRPASRLCWSCCSAAASTPSWPWRTSTTPPAKTPTRSRKRQHLSVFRENGSSHRILWFLFSNLKVFHTRNKQGVVMHPTSVFASDPEVLHVPEDDIRDMGKHTAKTQSGTLPLWSLLHLTLWAERYGQIVSSN